MPSRLSSADLAQLAADTSRAYQAFATAHHDAPRQLSNVLGELGTLQRALEQNQTLAAWTGREPPKLSSSNEILRQSLECLDKQSAASSRSSRPPHVRRDSGRTIEGEWSPFDHELTILWARLQQCTLKLKNLNFLTVLIAGFVDIDTTSERTALYRRTPGASHTSPDKDRELPELLNGFARNWNLHRRAFALPERAPRLANLEGENKDLLRRLVVFTGLESHPLAALTIPELSAECSMAYRQSIIDVESSTIRREPEVTVGYTSVVKDCRVTIQLDHHRDVEAVRFHLFDSHCRWMDQNDNVVLDHVFQKQRFPWRYTKEHKSPLTVSFTTLEMHGSVTKCYQEHRKDHSNLAPDYVFKDSTSYETFHRYLRGKPLIDEFEVKSIKAKNADTEKTEHSVIKLWGSNSDDWNPTITIPVTFVGNRVMHQELSLKWMTCVRPPSSKEVRLELKQAKRRASGASPSPTAPGAPQGRKPSLIKRIATISRSGTSPVDAAVVVDDPAPSKWVEKFPHFTLEFVDDNGREDFVKRFTLRQSTPSIRVSPRSSMRSLSIGSPLLSTSPSTFPRSTPNESIISGAAYSTPGTEEVSTSPQGITRQPSTRDLDLGPSYDDTSDGRAPESTASVQQDTAYATSQQWDEYLRRGGPQVPMRNVDMASSHGNPLAHYYTELQGGLDCIRLMRIEPGSGQDLCCYLEIHPLVHLPKYEALSYCWGRGLASEIISSGDLKGFPVSEHLLYAIRRLRHATRARRVWIDAICINQFNIEEKNKQISMMRKIYALALRTIIWLGDSSPARKACDRCYGDEDDEDTLCILPDNSVALEHADVSPDLPQDVLRLKDQDSNGATDIWFRRLWCVQEFHFSQRLPSVYIGRHAVRWDHFCTWFKASQDPLSLFHGLGQFKSDEVTQSHTLFELLWMTGALHCSDPRDRIFALLGMAKNAALAIQPDYRKSVIKTIEDACFSLIVESGSVDVLLDKRVSRAVWGSERFHNAVPSWIPDLTCLQTLDAVRSLDKYSAGPGVAEVKLVEESDTTDGFLDRPRILRLRAVFFDRIVTRTREQDIPSHERSTQGCLIYNSLERRGHLIEQILNTLDYRFDVEVLPARHQHPEILDQTPRLGRLFLDYLFEGKRSVKQELESRSMGPRRNVTMSYELQEEADLAYVRHENSLQDEQYVRERWRTKHSRVNEMYVPPPVRAAYNSDNDAFRDDFELARDLENLYAYARHSKQWYYLTVGKANILNFEAPMRKDVLTSPSQEEVMMLRTNFHSQSRNFEFHEYNAKSRERDFFKTSAGFVGLGPASLEKGDEIVVPLGSSRPLILRKCAGVLGSYYTLVGEAVVPGIMSGKWTKIELEKKDSAEWYRIK